MASKKVIFSMGFLLKVGEACDGVVTLQSQRLLQS